MTEFFAPSQCLAQSQRTSSHEFTSANCVNGLVSVCRVSWLYGRVCPKQTVLPDSPLRTYSCQRYRLPESSNRKRPKVHRVLDPHSHNVPRYSRGRTESIDVVTDATSMRCRITLCVRHTIHLGTRKYASGPTV